MPWRLQEGPGNSVINAYKGCKSRPCDSVKNARVILAIQSKRPIEAVRVFLATQSRIPLEAVRVVLATTRTTLDDFEPLTTNP